MHSKICNLIFTGNPPQADSSRRRILGIFPKLEKSRLSFAVQVWFLIKISSNISYYANILIVLIFKYGYLNFQYAHIYFMFRHTLVLLS